MIPIELKYGYEVITDIKGLENLKRDWNRLLQNSNANYPFLTFEWVYSWWRSFGKNKELFIIVIKDQERIVGIAPFMRLKRNIFKVIEFIGTGRSDYLDFIIDKDVSPEPVLGLVFKILKSHEREWDILNIQDILPNSCLFTCVGQDNGFFKKYSYISKGNVRTVSSFLNIDKSWDEYLRTKSRKHREQIRRKERILQKSKNLKIYYSDSQLDTAQKYEIVSSIEKESWKTEAGNPRLNGNDAGLFFKEIFKRFSENNWFQLWLLKDGDSYISYMLNFFYNNKIYYYNSAYKTGYERLSPGTLITISALKRAFDEKIKEYDFLRGDEEYKRRWATGSRLLYQIGIYKRNLKSKIGFLFVLNLRWILKQYPVFYKLISLKVKYFYKLNKVLRH